MHLLHCCDYGCIRCVVIRGRLCSGPQHLTPSPSIMADLDQSHVGECGRGIPLSHARTHFMIITNSHPSVYIKFTDIYGKVASTMM